MANQKNENEFVIPEIIRPYCDQRIAAIVSKMDEYSPRLKDAAQGLLDYYEENPEGLFNTVIDALNMHAHQFNLSVEEGKEIARQAEKVVRNLNLVQPEVVEQSKIVEQPQTKPEVVSPVVNMKKRKFGPDELQILQEIDLIESDLELKNRLDRSDHGDRIIGERL